MCSSMCTLYPTHLPCCRWEEADRPGLKVRIRELYCSVQFNVYTVSYTSPLLQMGGGGPPRAEGAPQTSEEGG